MNDKAIKIALAALFAELRAERQEAVENRIMFGGRSNQAGEDAAEAVNILRGWLS